jgi:hypothetical protein
MALYIALNGQDKPIDVDERNVGGHEVKIKTIIHSNRVQ